LFVGEFKTAKETAKSKKKSDNDNKLGTHGKISIYTRGYGWLPENLRKELEAGSPGEIPFFLDANCVLLVKPKASRKDVLRGLSALIRHLSAKWGISDEEVKKRLRL